MGGRNTAILLVAAILGSEMLLSGKLQAIWSALWSGPYPLGKGMTATSAAAPAAVSSAGAGSGGTLR